MRTVNLKGGPLDGKTYLVPDAHETIDHEDGHYRLTAKQGTWKATASDKP